MATTSPADPSAEAAPVAGELVELQAIQPSDAQQRSDARGRIGNTAVQTGIPGAVIVIGTWVCALGHIDLDPGPGTDMPAAVVGAFGALLTVLIAWKMNRTGLRSGR